MTKGKSLLLIAACVLLTSMLSAQPAHPLHVSLPEFEVQNVSVPNALVKAGQQAGVPLGIDVSDTAFLKRMVSFKRSNATLDEVLQQILAAGPAYTIHQDGKTIVIRLASRRANLLDTRITAFRTDGPTTVDELSFKLWMALVVQLSPSRQGFLGPGLSEINSAKAVRLPAVDLSGKTVGEILDWIVGTHGSAAWVGVPFDGEVGKSVGPNDFWRLQFYPSAATSPKH